MTPPLDASDFDAFYRAVYEKEPFPWQRRLVATVCNDGTWPPYLDLPTGSGKTAVLDIAVFAMAVDAARPAAERKLGRRVILVVDRRTVVDQTFERAQKLAGCLEVAEGDGRTTILGRVAEALTSLRGRPSGLDDRDRRSTSPRPLEVAYLRGAIPRDDSWTHDPSQPMIAVSTVDQVGSRLLFRGYGVSPGMRSIHAGLLGSHATYFLDEVHLSRAFAKTLAAVAKYRRSTDGIIAGGIRVVPMSATHRPDIEDGGSAAFSLTEEDHRHPVLHRRLNAPKPTTLDLIKVVGDEGKRRATFAQCLAELAAGAVTEHHRRIAVVVNRVDTALAVYDALAGTTGGADALLITGRMRPIDRDDQESRLDFARTTTPRAGDSPPRFVVATQCIEAGADLDFDVLVTECASLDALVQRFGRVDRLGEFHRGEIQARGIVAARSDQVGERVERDLVYGEALPCTWAYLEGLARGGGIDFGLHRRIADAAPPAVFPPNGRSPLLLPAHLDLWSQTSGDVFPDPEVGLWLHGLDRNDADVSIVWRADIRIEGDRDRDSVLDDVLTACPPLRREAVTIPLYIARRWLRGQSVPGIADVEGSEAPDEEWRDAAPMRPVILWKGADEVAKIVRHPGELRPGDTLVVPAAYGGLRSGTFSADATEPVEDRGDHARLQQRHRLIIRLAALVGSPLGDDEKVRPDDEVRLWQLKLRQLGGKLIEAHHDKVDDSAVRTALTDVRSHLAASPCHDWLRVLEKPRKKPLKMLLTPSGDEDDRDPWRRLIVHGPGKTLPPDARVTAETDESDFSTVDDQASLVGVRVGLAEHLAHVEAHARAFTATYNLRADLARAVAIAAAWHDAGKADPRFQRWLVGGDDVAAAALEEPLAKSNLARSDRRKQREARQRAGYPRGARHELLSVALLDATQDIIPPELDRELLMHLIASHHGWCRPHAPVEQSGDVVDVHWDHAGTHLRARSDHGLAHVGSRVVDNFWTVTERYGWWGLAWLEALVRLADHRASEAEQRGAYGEGLQGEQP